MVEKSHGTIENIQNTYCHLIDKLEAELSYLSSLDYELIMRHYYYYQPLSYIAKETNLSKETVKERVEKEGRRLRNSLLGSDRGNLVELFDQIKENKLLVHKPNGVSELHIMKEVEGGD